MEAKFELSDKRMKNDWHHSRWNVFTTAGYTSFDHKWRNFGRAECRTRWRETQKVQSNWLRRVTRMSKKRMPKVMLNY